MSDKKTHFSQNKHVNPDNFRSSGHYTPSQVEPKRLCEYLINKGVIFTLADEYHLDSCGYSFTVLPVRFTTARDKKVTLHCKVLDFSGPDDVLSPRQRKWRDGTLNSQYFSSDHTIFQVYPKC